MMKLKPSYIELERRVHLLQKELHQFKCIILEENQRKNRFLDDLFEGCQIIGFDWRYIYINNSASQHNKCPKEVLLGRKYMEAWPGIEKTEVFRKIKDCLENRNRHQMENEFLYPDGSLGWFDLSIQPIPEGVFILSIDTTVRKKIEKEIRSNIEKFKIIFESSNAGKSITLPTGEIEVNQAFCNMLGYSKNELQNKKWQEITPPEDVGDIEKNLVELINGKKDADRIIKRYIHKNGSIVWADLSLVLHRNEQGEPLFFISTLIDITEQKRIQEINNHNLELLDEMGRVAKIGAWEFDPETGKGTWTDEVARIHDLDPGVETNAEFGLSFYSGESRKLIEKGIHDAITYHKPYVFELQLKTAKGWLKWVRTQGKPILKDGKVIKIRGSFQDITERKLVELELIDNEVRFSAIFKFSPIPAAILDSKYLRYIEVNDAWCKIIGFKEKEVLGKSPVELGIIEQEHETELRNEFKKFGFIINKETEIRNKAGERKRILNSIDTFIFKNEKFRLNFFIDITERKLIERKLERNRRMMKTLLGNLSGMAYRCVNSKNWEMKFMSEGCKGLTGYEPGELIGNKNLNYNDLIYPDDRNKVWDGVQQAIRENRIFEMEYRIIRKDNKLRWVWERGKMIDSNSRQEILEGFITDITERKHASEALMLNEKRLNDAQFMAGMGDFTWEVESGKITWSNSLYSLLGYQKDDIIDFSMVNAEIHHPDDLEHVNQWLNECVSSGSNVLTPNEYRLVRKDKQIIYVRTQGIIERNDNNITRVFATILDITERKLSEQKIQKMNQKLELWVQERTSQLEKANKELQTFTYSVSHDLKAPLRGIDGYSKLLQELYENKLNEEARGFIRNIREGSIQMNQLIEDLLAYSRLERSALKMTQIQLQDFIGKILLLYQNEIEKQNIVLETHLPTGSIIADQNSLAMAIRNLIENSIKFSKTTQKPKIVIGMDEGEDSWVIYVKDNGIGFNMKYHERIFDIFQRLHRVEEYPGTGIGLAMVAKAMQRLGGRVWAKSQLNEGSTFYLKIFKKLKYENGKL